MKPLLAGELIDPTKLRFPVYASPKYDGIRALVVNGVLVSRTFKPIPNDHIRTMLSKPAFSGFDGEIIAGKTFQETTGNVMRKAGEPDFVFFVFDDFTSPNEPFEVRRKNVEQRVANLHHAMISAVNQTLCANYDAVKQEHCTNRHHGHEGTMVRSTAGIYKFGRSTEREGILLKLKDFIDIEVEIVGFDELMHNDNPAKKDAFGRTKRGSSKQFLTPGGMLGALVVTHPDYGVFCVGTGFDAKTRQDIWDNQPSYLGKLAKIRFQLEGTKDKPRIPSFQGIRDPIDI